MAIKFYSEASLLDSEVFKALTDLDGDNPIEVAKRSIQVARANDKILSQEQLGIAYIHLKGIPNTLSKEALKAFDTGSTKLVYTETKETKVTDALPFITFGAKGNYQTYIFLDRGNTVKINKEGVLTIDHVRLHDLLIGALISNKLKIGENEDRLLINPYLQKTLMELYNRFICRILNREFAIAADKIVFDVIQYWINRFFLTRIFRFKGDPETLELIAGRHFKFIDNLKADEIRRAYNEASPLHFGNMLELLKQATARMQKITLGSFLSQWTNYYYPPSLLAIDNIDYLIFMIICLLNTSGMLSISASEIVREYKGITNLRAELLKLV